MNCHSPAGPTSSCWMPASPPTNTVQVLGICAFGAAATWPAPVESTVPASNPARANRPRYFLRLNTRISSPYFLAVTGFAYIPLVGEVLPGQRHKRGGNTHKLNLLDARGNQPPVVSSKRVG